MKFKALSFISLAAGLLLPLLLHSLSLSIRMLTGVRSSIGFRNKRRLTNTKRSTGRKNLSLSKTTTFRRKRIVLWSQRSRRANRSRMTTSRRP